MEISLTYVLFWVLWLWKAKTIYRKSLAINLSGSFLKLTSASRSNRINFKSALYFPYRSQEFGTSNYQKARTLNLFLCADLTLNIFSVSDGSNYQRFFVYFLLLYPLYPRREAGILWIHHRCHSRPRPRPQRFLVSNLQSIFLSGFLSYFAGGLIW